MRILLGLAVSFAFCAAALADPPQQAIDAGYKNLVFSDDFNTLDMSPDGGGTHRWYNGLWQRGPVNPARFSVQDGVVRLTTDVDPRAIIMTTAITTMPRKQPGTATTFRYGYFEARMRYNPGPFAWPAFWLLSADRPAINDKAGRGHWCEIDIFEGGRPTHYQGTVHDWRDFKSISNANQHFLLPPTADLRQWNTYGALWTPSKITWFFNGIALGSAPTPRICQQQQLFLILGAQKRKFGPQPESLDVDWVHAYR
ncbi:glycoside hydrolase family 16 protein [uncultured Novosphingobium sp.]|uniref:glycoside hydrolase family 16 protein n=1 Tax=uncultured Novosphingobium sp. TaxID=292277 RepID=UPI00258FAF52|nr:glycoside hydrolase family 16 protein [uncultured Novosphingobium sp.]